MSKSGHLCGDVPELVAGAEGEEVGDVPEEGEEDHGDDVNSRGEAAQPAGDMLNNGKIIQV